MIDENGRYWYPDAGDFVPEAAGRGWSVVEPSVLTDGTVLEARWRISGKRRQSDRTYDHNMAFASTPEAAVRAALALYP